MTMTTSHKSALLSGTGITRIKVNDLFGQYSYNLKDKVSRDGFASKALLLYGDNGSGKTTILQLLFYLLSHIDEKGHKTRASKIRFSLFQVSFIDGTEVIASRKDLQDTFYSLTINRNGRQIASCTYPDQEPSSYPGVLSKELIPSYTRSKKRTDDHKHLLEALEELQLGLIYLTDSRKVLSTVDEADSSEERDHRFIYSPDYIRFKATESNDAEQINRAVEQISSWATRQAFKGSTRGEEDVNSVYATVIQRLASNNPSANISIDGLITKLRAQEKRAEEFARFGLTKPVKAQPIVDALALLNKTASTQALNLLEPYVSGIEKRLNALDPIREQLSSFTDLMNSFFGSGKSVTLNMNEGIRIVAKNSDELAPALLSSGERQLLYLLASTIVAKEKSHIFMIDEPEISLNVRWQRKLISALLDLTKDANIQFVLATHSVELLTQYEDCVLDLESNR